MQITSRLKALEQKAVPSNAADTPAARFERIAEAVRAKRAACEHPPAMFHIRKDRPPGSWRADHTGSRELIVMGHCDACSYDAPLWDLQRLSDREAEQVRGIELSDADEGEREYVLGLIDRGLLRYAAWPPSGQCADDVRAMGYTWREK